MNDAELMILRHALGMGEDGRGAPNRNYFVTGPGSADYDACCALAEHGLMTRREGNAVTGGDPIFYVTDAGRTEAAKHAPPPVTETRSQRRYREFLDADTGLRFGEWLKGRGPARLAGERVE